MEMIQVQRVRNGYIMTLLGVDKAPEQYVYANNEKLLLGFQQHAEALVPELPPPIIEPPKPPTKDEDDL